MIFKTRRVVVFKNFLRSATVFFVCVGLAACGDSPESTVKKYLNSVTAKERSEYVLNPEETYKIMSERYRELKTLKKDYENVSSEKLGITPGEWYYVTASLLVKDESGEEIKDIAHYFVEKEKNGYKIDWQASVGQGEMGWMEFIANRPSAPKMMRTKAKLFGGSCSGLGDASQDFYSIVLNGPNDENSIFACLFKNSKAGGEIFEILKSGEEKDITLSIFYPSRVEYPVFPIEKVIIKDLVSQTWVVQ